MANINVTRAVYDRLNVYPHTKEKLNRLKVREGCTLAQLVEDTATFLLKTGIHPKDDFESSTKHFANIEQLIKKRTDTIISFFKKGEESITIPTYNKVSNILEIMAGKEIEAGRTEQKSEPVVSHQGHTVEADQLIRLKEENDELKQYLIDVVSKITVSQTVTRNVVYTLNITENLYNELKSNFFE